ncbi:hypothetical protein DFH07DRAFT_551672 [Mycena maculata]|uniref:Alcohol dehydrogenase n=1 Tax=Mycena maculata TaxID=230809 RepID=A0AAD7ITF7_9AGAR|nr:hypothetical protein DFH07DRAFT_551672 [Mycena maculata]
MKPMGGIYPVTISGTDLVLPATLVTRGFKIEGSAMRGQQVEMLEFAGAHKITPIIERFPMTKEGVEASLTKLRAGYMRCRAVLVV